MTTAIFLIMADLEKQHPIGSDLRASGLFVNEYMSVCEFFLDKPNPKGGIIFSEVSLPELSGITLVESLAKEKKDFPVVLLPSGREVPSVIMSRAEFLIRPVDAETIREAVKWTVKPKQHEIGKLRWGFEHLTPLEMQTVRSIVEGKTPAEYAAETGVPLNIVEAFRTILYPRTTQGSLPAAGQALPDGLSTRRTPTKGLRFAFYISSSFPKLLGAITSTELSSCG